MKYHQFIVENISKKNENRIFCLKIQVNLFNCYFFPESQTTISRKTSKTDKNSDIRAM